MNSDLVGKMSALFLLFLMGILAGAGVVKLLMVMFS